MKRIISALLLVIMLLSLSACGCEHEWASATCTSPKTCTKCGETEGEALGHTWAEATCTSPKTCTACAATEGEPIAHTWAEATCTSPKTCTVCAATEGEPAGHEPVLQTIKGNTRTDLCSVCGETLTSPVSDMSAEAPALIIGSWEASSLYNGIEVNEIADTFGFEFRADGTVVSDLPENPGEGVFSFDSYNEWLEMFRFVAEVNGVTYDIAFVSSAPDELQWWYRDRYAAYISQRQ